METYRIITKQMLFDCLKKMEQEQICDTLWKLLVNSESPMEDDGK